MARGPSPRTTKPSARPDPDIRPPTFFCKSTASSTGPRWADWRRPAASPKPFDRITIIRPRDALLFDILDTTFVTGACGGGGGCGKRAGHAANPRAAGIDQGDPGRLPGFSDCRAQGATRGSVVAARGQSAPFARAAAAAGDTHVRGRSGDRAGAVCRPAGPGRACDPCTLFGMLNWFYLLAQAGAGPIDRDAYADIVADLVIGGLPKVCE